MERLAAIAATVVLLIGVVVVVQRQVTDDQPVVSNEAASELASESETESATESESSAPAATDSGSEAEVTPTPTESTPTATPTSEPSATVAPTPTASETPPPSLPAPTPMDPATVGQLGPGRYEVALLRGVRVSFSIPEGQTYDVIGIGARDGSGNLGLALVQPVDAGVSGVAIYTAYGVGAVRDGASVVEGFDDVPGSWSTFTNFQVGPAPAETTLGGDELAAIGWSAALNGQESVPGRGPRVDLFAFDRAEDGSPQFSFADDGDVGSSWFTLLGPREGLDQVAFVADAFASGAVDAVPAQHDELRRSLAIES